MTQFYSFALLYCMRMKKLLKNIFSFTTYLLEVIAVATKRFADIVFKLLKFRFKFLKSAVLTLSKCNASRKTSPSNFLKC